MRLTNSRALLTEADLPSLSTRAKMLTATEVSRFKRLLDDEPTRRKFENAPRPQAGLPWREAWLRARVETSRKGTAEPEPPDRDVAALSRRPCTRRVGAWVLREAGIADTPVTPVTTFPRHPRGSEPGQSALHRHPSREDETHRPASQAPASHPACNRGTPASGHYHLDRRLV